MHVYYCTVQLYFLFPYTIHMILFFCTVHNIFPALRTIYFLHYGQYISCIMDNIFPALWTLCYTISCTNIVYVYSIFIALDTLYLLHSTEFPSPPGWPLDLTNVFVGCRKYILKLWKTGTSKRRTLMMVSPIKHLLLR